MKKLIFILFAVATVTILYSSCSKKKDEVKPAPKNYLLVHGAWQAQDDHCRYGRRKNSIPLKHQPFRILSQTKVRSYPTDQIRTIACCPA